MRNMHRCCSPDAVDNLVEQKRGAEIPSLHPIQSARMALIVQAVLLECLDNRLTDVGDRVGHIDADRVECLDLVGSRALAA